VRDASPTRRGENTRSKRIGVGVPRFNGNEGMKTGMVGLSSYTAVEKRYGDSIVEFVEKLLPLDGGG